MPRVDRFAARLARLDTRVDARLAETVRFVPLTDGVYSGRLPDAQARPAFEVDGLVTITPRNAADLGGQASHMMRTRQAAYDALLDIDRAALTGRERVLRENDRVELVMRNITMLVAGAPDVSRPGRIRIHLVIAAQGEIAGDTT